MITLQQGHIQSIKSDNQDICNITKEAYLK